MLPSCLAALGLRTTSRSVSTFTTRRPTTVAKAAARAVANPGSEVSATSRGRGGRWAQLLRRGSVQVPIGSNESDRAVTSSAPAPRDEPAVRY